MRVVAGQCRGRRLVTPDGKDTRPTTDRVREATFNALGSMGVIDGATVLDLFAGSGALGIEALSRGADHVTFVDHDRAAVAAIQANLDACGLSSRARVEKLDSHRALAGFLASSAGQAFDLVFLDPPYVFDAWADLLSQVGGLSADTVMVESDRPVEVPPPWVVVRQKAYGTTLVTLLEREEQPPPFLFPTAASAPEPT